MKQITTAQALRLVEACKDGGDLVMSQALRWAARVAEVNARRVGGVWTSYDFYYLVDAGPDMVAYLRGATPSIWMDTQL
jgi:NADH:ubiquinone oxidoreductase subunit E